MQILHVEKVTTPLYLTPPQITKIRIKYTRPGASNWNTLREDAQGSCLSSDI